MFLIEESRRWPKKLKYSVPMILAFVLPYTAVSKATTAPYLRSKSTETGQLDRAGTVDILREVGA